MDGCYFINQSKGHGEAPETDTEDAKCPSLAASRSKRKESTRRRRRRRRRERMYPAIDVEGDIDTAGVAVRVDENVFFVGYGVGDDAGLVGEEGEEDDNVMSSRWLTWSMEAMTVLQVKTVGQTKRRQRLVVTEAESRSLEQIMNERTGLWRLWRGR